VIAICQVDDQLLKTILCDEDAITLLGSYHIEGGEVLDPTGIRNEALVEGLEGQDDALTPCHQLRGGHSVMVQKIADKVHQGELQSQGQYLRVKVYTTSLGGLCIIGI